MCGGGDNAGVGGEGVKRGVGSRKTEDGRRKSKDGKSKFDCRDMACRVYELGDGGRETGGKSYKIKLVIII